jgi:hypothetical protein
MINVVGDGSENDVSLECKQDKSVVMTQQSCVQDGILKVGLYTKKKGFWLTSLHRNIMLASCNIHSGRKSSITESMVRSDEDAGEIGD